MVLAILLSLGVYEPNYRYSRHWPASLDRCSGRAVAVLIFHRSSIVTLSASNSIGSSVKSSSVAFTPLSAADAVGLSTLLIIAGVVAAVIGGSFFITVMCAQSL